MTVSLDGNADDGMAGEGDQAATDLEAVFGSAYNDTLSGTQGGQVLAPAIFLPLAAALPDEALLSWGWRVPFWLSAFMVVGGFIIRRKLDETPEFLAEADKAQVPAAPLGVLFRDHWRGVLRVFFAAFIATVNTMFAVFALEFATSDDIGISDTWMLWVAIVANVVAVLVIPLWARLSDRVGRKPVFVTGVVGSAVLVFPFLGAIEQGNEALVMVVGVLLAGFVYSMPNAVCVPILSGMDQGCRPRACRLRSQATSCCAGPAGRRAANSGTPGLKWS